MSSSRFVIANYDTGEITETEKIERKGQREGKRERGKGWKNYRQVSTARVYSFRVTHPRAVWYNTVYCARISASGSHSEAQSSRYAHMVSGRDR